MMSPVQRSALRRYKLLVRAVLIGSVWSVLTSTIIAQELVDNADEPQKVSAPSKAELSGAPAKVDINPLAHDDEIGQRLQAVLDATGWFLDPQVRVEEGVVLLNGRTETEELKKWAGDLARNTQDVGPVKRFSAESPREELDAPSTKAEGGLSSEADVIGEQARQVQPLNDGENLLTVGSGVSSADEKPKKQNNSGKKAAG